MAKSPIREWALEDRPREKLLQHGIHTLSNTELIAILIGSGTSNLTAVDLARELLATVDNNLHKLGKQTVMDLMRLKGIGEAKAISIVAAMELGKRRKYDELDNPGSIKSSRDAFNCFHPIVSDLTHEEFWLLLLNRANRVLEKCRLSQGGTSGTVIDVKILVRIALEKGASAVILCHNHPSGNNQPSHGDIDITKKIRVALEYMDIKLLDHIIVADSRYYSFADEGEL